MLLQQKRPKEFCRVSRTSVQTTELFKCFCRALALAKQKHWAAECVCLCRRDVSEVMKEQSIYIDTRFEYQ